MWYHVFQPDPLISAPHTTRSLPFLSLDSVEGDKLCSNRWAKVSYITPTELTCVDGATVKMTNECNYTVQYKSERFWIVQKIASVNVLWQRDCHCEKAWLIEPYKALCYFCHLGGVWSFPALGCIVFPHWLKMARSHTKASGCEGLWNISHLNVAFGPGPTAF